MHKLLFPAIFCLIAATLGAQLPPKILGRIDGDPVYWHTMRDYEQTLYKGLNRNTFERRALLWNYFVENALVHREARRIGLDVPEAELNQLQFGDGSGSDQVLSPVIRRRFTGPDGLVDFAALEQIRFILARGLFDPQQQHFWDLQKAEIEKDRLESKLGSLLTQGCYVPAWQAEMLAREHGEKAELQYVSIPYDKIGDADAVPTDADLSAFIGRFPSLFEQRQEQRILEYVALPVTPSEADLAAVSAEVAALRPAWLAAGNDSVFVTDNGGAFGVDYILESGWPAAIADALRNATAGDLIGPFFEAGECRMVRVLDRKVVPDSVRCRHLLLRGETAAEQKADALLEQITTGRISFEAAAQLHSEDPGSASRGGLLGWVSPGAFVPEFDRICFFTGEPGRVYKVKTAFGWHLVEILDRNFIGRRNAVRLASLGRPAVARRETIERVSARAESLRAEAGDLAGLTRLAQREGLTLVRTPPLNQMAYDWPGLPSASEESRQIVRDAFRMEQGEGQLLPRCYVFPNPERPVEGHFAVIALRQVLPAGPATPASLRAFPNTMQQVVNAKKAERIAAQTPAGASLEKIARQWGCRVETAANLLFSQSQLPGNTYRWSSNDATSYTITVTDVTQQAVPPAASARPDHPFDTRLDPSFHRLIGWASAAPLKEVKGPVAEPEAVCFFRVIRRQNGDSPAPKEMLRRQARFQAMADIRRNWLPELRRRANIEDFRSRYY